MSFGEATSDTAAFQKVLERLEGDVGGILALVMESRGNGGKIAPFWALARMMFPIAESIGDLIYRNDVSPVKNLKYVLKNEFEHERPGRYCGIENTLPVLYRHSLAHTDEMRCLITTRSKISWEISCGGNAAGHLKIRKVLNGIVIPFEVYAFYDDISKVCKTAMAKSWNGEVMERYNSWLTLDLDSKPQKYRDTIAEITTLV